MRGHGMQQGWSQAVRGVTEALGHVPWRAWERAVSQGAAFQQMRQIAHSYPQGAFITLMVVAGLNDYQLKGKAEIAYWPALAKHVEESPPPDSPLELATLLEPFYNEERMPSQKVKRLERFLTSSLAQQLWSMSAAEAAQQIRPLWHEIARAMGQPPAKKTIAFSAKILASTLVSLGETGFEFTGIPVAVDSRLQKLTPSLDEESVREFWDAVLARLREVEGRLTAVHLDSFLWQYAGADNHQAYLRQMGLSKSEAEPITKAFSTLRRLRG